MLLGHDISKWNSGIDVNTGDFTMMKVTEGVTYVDPKCAEYVRQLNDEQLIGCYHFLRADNEKKGNTPAKEAQNFINQVNKLGLLYKAVLVVDYEAGSIGHEDYLLNFQNMGEWINDNYYDEDSLHEECGVFGAYDFDGGDVEGVLCPVNRDRVKKEDVA